MKSPFVFSHDLDNQIRSRAKESIELYEQHLALTPKKGSFVCQCPFCGHGANKSYQWTFKIKLIGKEYKCSCFNEQCNFGIGRDVFTFLAEKLNKTFPELVRYAHDFLALPLEERPKKQYQHTPSELDIKKKTHSVFNPKDGLTTPFFFQVWYSEHAITSAQPEKSFSMSETHDNIKYWIFDTSGESNRIKVLDKHHVMFAITNKTKFKDKNYKFTAEEESDYLGKYFAQAIQNELSGVVRRMIQSAFKHDESKRCSFIPIRFVASKTEKGKTTLYTPSIASVRFGKNKSSELVIKNEWKSFWNNACVGNIANYINHKQIIGAIQSGYDLAMPKNINDTLPSQKSQSHQTEAIDKTQYNPESLINTFTSTKNINTRSQR